MSTLAETVRWFAIRVSIALASLAVVGAVLYGAIALGPEPLAFDPTRQIGPVAECIPPPAARTEEEPAPAQAQYYRCFYAYYRHNLLLAASGEAKEADHRSRTFEWKLLADRYLFALVVLITLSGVAMAWIAIAKGQPGEHSFEASLADGVKVKSPTIGLIILVISLAFLYLYATHFYPITEVGSSRLETPAVAK